MEEIHFLEKHYKGRWCGIRFSNNGYKKCRIPKHPLSFCEAVSLSRTGPLLLTPDLLDCPGGSRSLGWFDDDPALVDSIVEKSGVNEDTIQRIVRHTPKLHGNFDQVIIGTDKRPDICISLAQPEDVMNFIRKWQKLTGRLAQIEVSSFMAVCGSVAAKTYNTGDISISFGCPESRKNARIGRDRLIIGVSRQQVLELMHGNNEKSCIAQAYKA